MGYTVLASGLVLIVVAWACYQYPNLINPYGNLPQERKELVDIEGLKKACAIILGITGFLLVVTATLHLLKVIDEDVCGVTLMVLVFAMMVPLSIAMKRYNAFGRDQYGKIKNPTIASKEPWVRRTSKIFLVLTGVTLVIVAVILVLSFRPTKITVGEETVKISGMYGCKIPVSDVVSVALLDTLPRMTRTNGSDTGHRLKGHFKIKGGEKCMVFVVKQAPYLELRTTDNLYYLNAGNQEETETLYRQLKQLKP